MAIVDEGRNDVGINTRSIRKDEGCEARTDDTKEAIIAGFGYEKGATEVEGGECGKFFGVVVEDCVVDVAAECEGEVTKSWDDRSDGLEFVGFNLYRDFSMRRPIVLRNASGMGRREMG